MSYTNPIFELLEITKRNELELVYLINLSKQFNILDKVKEHIFQFNPTYDENGRNQTFSTYYKESLISETIIFLLEAVAEKKVFQNLNIEEKEIRIEDFSNYFFDLFLNERENNELIKYLMKNDLSNKSNEEIISQFYDDNIDYLNKYFKEED